MSDQTTIEVVLSAQSSVGNPIVETVTVLGTVPIGPQGPPGPEGPEGPQGPPGEGGGGGGAPTDATYLVATTNGTLSAEVVVGATPGGELGNTWASPTVDAVHSGSSHAAVQSAAEATAAAALTAHSSDTTSVHGITDTAQLATLADLPVEVDIGDLPAADAFDGAELAVVEQDGVAQQRSYTNILDDLGVVLESLFNANTVLAATTDNTPAALTVAEQTLLGRITGGNIDDLTPTQVRTLLGLVIGTDVQAYSADLTDLVAKWNPASSAGTASLSFPEDTDNGSDFISLLGQTSLSATRLVALPDRSGELGLLADTLEINAQRHGKVVGQYYQDIGGASTTATAPALNRMLLIPKLLPAGTLDRVGIEVSTLEATSVCRLGVYTHSSSTNLPVTLIAEATGTTDNSSAGNKELTISAVIPTFGIYWWALVVQTASSAVRFRTVGSPSTYPAPLGTSAPSTGANISYMRHQSSVSGALPSTIGTVGTSETLTPPRFFYRFSA